jgi:hypothetical protein
MIDRTLQAPAPNGLESESHHAGRNPPTVRKQGDKNVASPCFHHTNVAKPPGSELIMRFVNFNYFEP